MAKQLPKDIAGGLMTATWQGRRHAGTCELKYLRFGIARIHSRCCINTSRLDTSSAPSLRAAGPIQKVEFVIDMEQCYGGDSHSWSRRICFNAFFKHITGRLQAAAVRRKICRVLLYHVNNVSVPIQQPILHRKGGEEEGESRYPREGGGRICAIWSNVGYSPCENDGKSRKQDNLPTRDMCMESGYHILQCFGPVVTGPDTFSQRYSFLLWKHADATIQLQSFSSDTSWQRELES